MKEKGYLTNEVPWGRASSPALPQTPTWALREKGQEMSLKNWLKSGGNYFFFKLPRNPTQP